MKLYRVRYYPVAKNRSTGTCADLLDYLLSFKKTTLTTNWAQRDIALLAPQSFSVNTPLSFRFTKQNLAFSSILAASPILRHQSFLPLSESVHTWGKVFS